MNFFVISVFAVVYLGMALGGLPLLQLDRTGIALLGAIAMVAGGALSVDQARAAVHLPTLLLLFAFMVMSAQMRLGGFYDEVSRRIAAHGWSDGAMLAAAIAAVAAMSAVFGNDIVCLAATPVFIDALRRRGSAPLPFLIALACAANIGSAATLVGNPQNILIGETLRLSFGGYMREAALPVLGGLVATWLLVRRHLRPAPRHEAAEPALAFDRWQSAKGGIVVAVVGVLFVCSDLPRDVVALAGAGVLLSSRKLHSRQMLGLVDWNLLVLFVGLFVVNAALQHTGLPQRALHQLLAWGIPLQHSAAWLTLGFVLSNLVSNVPAVMLLLPSTPAALGPGLALATTFAGNLFLLGSIANLIVADAAQRRGLRLGWREHAAVGAPLALLTLALTLALT
ncbi:inner membrane protein YbiR [mine drainage metagenome]|jgi:Na+/H+ antiporter NhaD/arsenite permease-like protein|uniref:Inner membrane protein YbiR n=1 Tax=mine drainage metagenome TaxID=410659 RepID=A0A1J5QWY4_9ZZZZ